jgi:hydrogenase maturation protease
MSDKISVLCFGNELHGDDGVAIHIFRKLAESAWPGNIDIINAGITGLNALAYLESCKYAILVDALDNQGSPGKIHEFRPAERNLEIQFGNSHETGIPYLLDAMKALFLPQPEILIIGIEIAEIKPFCLQLSPFVSRCIDPAVSLIKDRLEAAWTTPS